MKKVVLLAILYLNPLIIFSAAAADDPPPHQHPDPAREIGGRVYYLANLTQFKIEVEVRSRHDGKGDYQRPFYDNTGNSLNNADRILNSYTKIKL